MKNNKKIFGLILFAIIIVGVSVLFLNPLSVSADGRTPLKLYWGNVIDMTINRSNLNGSSQEVVVQMPGSPHGVAVDSAAGKVYWAEQWNGSVMRSNFDGTETEVLLQLADYNDARGIALDLVNNKMYLPLNENQEVWRANLDGSNFEFFTEHPSDPGGSYPHDVVVDDSGTTVFWSSDESDSILSAPIATGVSTELLTGLTKVRGLGIDHVNGKIYWAQLNGEIGRMDFDGTNVEIDIVPGLDKPHDVTVDPVNGKIYITDQDDEVIYRADLDGSNLTLMYTATYDVRGIIYDAVSQNLFFAEYDWCRLNKFNLASNANSVIKMGCTSDGIAIDDTNGNIFWFDNWLEVILRTDSNGDNVKLFYDVDEEDVGDLAIDQVTRYLYWGNEDDDDIYRASTVGSPNVQVVVQNPNDFDPHGMAIDYVNRKLYWTDHASEEIYRSNLDGSNKELLISGLGDGIRSIGVDAEEGYIFWSDTYLDGIYRADLDGTNIKLLATGVTFAYGLVVDPTTNSVFFSESDFVPNNIYRMDYNGNQDIVVSSPFSYAFALQYSPLGNPDVKYITATGGTLYFADGLVRFPAMDIPGGGDNCIVRFEDIGTASEFGFKIDERVYDVTVTCGDVNVTEFDPPIQICIRPKDGVTANKSLFHRHGTATEFNELANSNFQLDGYVCSDVSQLSLFLASGQLTLPATGFAQGVVTKLEAQPASAELTTLNTGSNDAIRLNIPQLGVQANIMGVPSGPSGWDVNWLGNDVGYLSGTAFPTWAGNTVLTGHVWDANNNPGVFAGLEQLKYGDRFTIEAWGSTYTYEVRTTSQFKATDLSAIKSSDYDIVTLITCEDFNPVTGEYGLRRVVSAVLIAID